MSTPHSTKLLAYLRRLASLPAHPRASSTRHISAAGIALIKRFEGCARLRGDGTVEAYPDPGTGGEPWTIGWGATGRDDFNGAAIGPGTRWTQAQCDARLAADLRGGLFERLPMDLHGHRPRSNFRAPAFSSFRARRGPLRASTSSCLPFRPA